METHNEKTLKDFMSQRLDDPDKFYLIHVIKRRKDNPDMDQSERIIRSYTIPDMDYFDRILPEIKMMCDMFNARAYMYINRRSFKGVAKAMLKRLADNVVDGQMSGLSRLYQSCASAHGAGDGYWILDLDFKLRNENEVIVEKSRENCFYCVGAAIAEFLNGPEVQPVGHKTVMFLNTRSGMHIVTSRFDTRKMDKLQEIVQKVSEKIPYNVEVELKKDAMVNLYIPTPNISSETLDTY